MSGPEGHEGQGSNATFVSFRPEASGPERRGVPRLSHKKSRNGCQRCRARRVKVRPFVLEKVDVYSHCNEVHPVCGSCQRHGVQCIYNNPSVRVPVDRASLDQAPPKQPLKGASEESSKERPESISTADLDSSYPESEQRRLLELRLLHQWTTRSALSFPGIDDKSYREAMIHDIPKNAMRHPAWLYTIFTFSAIHISKTSPYPSERREFMDTYHKYLDLALQEHRRDIANLCQEKADAICMTSSLIRNCTQALVQDRPLSPYEPPSQWMHMMSGSGDVFKTAWNWIGEDDTSFARMIATTGPNLSKLEELFSDKKREAFNHLLRRTPADEESEPWSPEIQRAYELPLSYIGGLQIAIDSGESAASICRRVISFLMFVPRRYIELVEEGHPRALVILAHYLAFLARLRGMWWIGDTGRREIRAIRSVVKGEWLKLLDWPLQVMDETCEIAPWEYN